MSLFCLFGRHVPSLASISRGKQGDYLAYCGDCALPLERDQKGRWRPAEPLSRKSTAT